MQSWHPLSMSEGIVSLEGAGEEEDETPALRSLLPLGLQAEADFPLQGPRGTASSLLWWGSVSAPMYKCTFIMYLHLNYITFHSFM